MKEEDVSLEPKLPLPQMTKLTSQPKGLTPSQRAKTSCPPGSLHHLSFGKDVPALQHLVSFERDPSIACWHMMSSSISQPMSSSVSFNMAETLSSHFWHQCSEGGGSESWNQVARLQTTSLTSRPKGLTLYLSGSLHYPHLQEARPPRFSLFFSSLTSWMVSQSRHPNLTSKTNIAKGRGSEFWTPIARTTDDNAARGQGNVSIRVITNHLFNNTYKSDIVHLKSKPIWADF